MSACAQNETPPPAATVDTQSAGQGARTPPVGQAPARPDTVSKPPQGSGEWTAGVTEVPGTGGVAVLQAIRVGRHEEFERITFEFAGNETPGYHIEYVDRPVIACGSGDVVPLAGDAWLSIRFHPAAAHTEEGKPTLGSRTLSVKQPILREMKQTCDFEADVTWVTGQSRPARYKVTVLRSPLRVVIDLRG